MRRLTITLDLPDRPPIEESDALHALALAVDGVLRIDGLLERFERAQPDAVGSLRCESTARVLGTWSWSLPL